MWVIKMSRVHPLSSNNRWIKHFKTHITAEQVNLDENINMRMRKKSVTLFLTEAEYFIHMWTPQRSVV